MTSNSSGPNVERILLGLRRYLGAIGAAGKYLLLKPFLKSKDANRFCFGVLSLQDELGYRFTDIPMVPLLELFPEAGDSDVKVGKVFPWEGSSISAMEVLQLGAIISSLRPECVFEIGTSVGVTAYNLALNLPEGGKLYTLDLPPAGESDSEIKTQFKVTVSDRKMIYGDRKDRRFLETEVGERITQLYGDSANFDYSPYHGKCDLVFVDGSHAYDYVKSDTAAALRLAKPGGWIIWHDYNDGFFWPEVRRYLKEFSNEKKVWRIEGTMFAACRV